MTFGPFSVLPNSLPNFFGLTGQAVPKALEETLRGIITIEPWLIAANCLETIVPATFNAAGGFNAIPSFVVPEGEGWLLRGACCGWFSVAGQEMRGRMCITRATGAGPIITGLGDEGVTSLTGAVGAGQAWSAIDRGTILVAGDAMAFLCSTVTGVVAVQPQAAIFRFSI